MRKLFGKRLKELRIANCELQADLADCLEVDKSMISLWETGKNYPEVKKLIEVACHYGVSADYLLGLSDKKQIEE